MKISLNWLRDYIAFDGDADALDHLLTRAGLEAASRHTTGADFPNVVVAQIQSSEQHPNADRLSVCQVDDGSGHPRQIVCGAKNYRVGDKVPLALPGAVLPGDFKIKTGKLRGVESQGMMCSAKELKLAEDADGLLILSADAPVGAPISTLFPPDAILELEITSNRPDWLSHLGIAREVRAFTGGEIKIPVSPIPAMEAAPEAAQIANESACPFYSVRRISGVRVGPSPDWLRARVESIGLRAINNVVDITNFVMFELGQPLHAFDAAKVSGGIAVRNASEGESLLTLDGTTVALDPEDLLIADSQSPLALAGVMGGEDSGVTESTTDILLESALFQPTGIRRTARRHGFQTDSSYRFERGVDPSGVLDASARATALILEIAGGTASECVTTAGALPPALPHVTLRPARCRALLGFDISDDEVRTHLTRLGLVEIPGDSADAQKWAIPSWRGDLVREVDLYEEVIRLAGIERVTGVARALPSASSESDARYDVASDTRHRLVGMGFTEARTSTLVSRNLRPGATVLEVRNPLGDEQSALRSSLIDGLLPAIERNLNHGAQSVRLFEIGRVFAVAQEEELAHVALVMTGPRHEAHWQLADSGAIDIFDLKGAVEAILPGCDFLPTTDPRLAAAWEIKLGGFVVGIAGILHPASARGMRARSHVVVAEVRFDAIVSVASAPRRYTPVPKFPGTSRDLAVVVPLDVPCATIESTLTQTAEPLLASVRAFDVFTDPSGTKLPADRKSLAFSLTFRAPDRTLTTDEVNEAHERLKTALKSALPVEFRE